MRTCQFKNAEVLTLVEIIAAKWFMAKVYTLAPIYERCWNHPVPGNYPNTPEGRKKWQRVKEGEAAEYRSILLALGVPELPTIDAGMYVRKCRPADHQKPGDLEFMLGGDERRKYREATTASIVSSV